jgi:hypothetical protein
VRRIRDGPARAECFGPGGAVAARAAGWVPMKVRAVLTRSKPKAVLVDLIFMPALLFL